MLSYVSATPRRELLNIMILLAILAAALGSASPAAAATHSLISIGQSGANVTTIQYLLRHRGYSLPATGTFGPLTDASVKAFQRTVPMQPNGIVGPVTWSKLVVEVRAGARSEAVKAVQVQLNKRGYWLAVDGSYGPNTQRAVVAFKQKAGLNSNTTVGPLTWQALIGTSIASPSTTTYAANGYVYTGRRAQVLHHLQQRFGARITTYTSHTECPTCSADLWTPGARFGMDNTGLQSMHDMAEYIRANSASLGVRHIIWNQRRSSGGAWQQMDDRGSLTANHKDHVHITFLDTFR